MTATHQTNNSMVISCTTRHIITAGLESHGSFEASCRIDLADSRRLDGLMQRLLLTCFEGLERVGRPFAGIRGHQKGMEKNGSIIATCICAWIWPVGIVVGAAGWACGVIANSERLTRPGIECRHVPSESVARKSEEVVLYSVEASSEL